MRPHRLSIALLSSAAVLAVAPASASAITVANAKSFLGTEGTQVQNARIVTFDDTGACNASAYSVQINWGDGTIDAGTIPKAVQAFPGTCTYDGAGTHTYQQAGQYAVTATVCLGTTCATTPTAGTATMRQADFRGQAQTFAATAGAVFIGQVAELKDDNPFSQASEFTASIDWGDGTPATTGLIAGTGGNFTINGTHTYAAAGGYRIAVTVTHAGRALVLDPANTTVGAPAITPTGGGPPAPTATARVLGGRVTLSSLRRFGLRVRIGISETRATRLLVRLRDSRSGRTLWAKRISIANSKVRNGQRTATVRIRLPRSVLNRLKVGRRYGITFPRQAGLPSFGISFRLR